MKVGFGRINVNNKVTCVLLSAFLKKLESYLSSFALGTKIVHRINPLPTKNKLQPIIAHNYFFYFSIFCSAATQRGSWSPHS
jgi:hypothetical protein